MTKDKVKCVECGKRSETHLCDACRTHLSEEVIGDIFKVKGIMPIKVEVKEVIPTQEVAHVTLDKDKLEQFILAGNATFTLWNTKKGTHLTYKVRVSKDNPELFFVYILTGPDNWTNYSFLGIIREGIYWHGKRSKITKDATSAKTFEWFYNNIGHLPDALQVLHEGKCGRCGRKLTVPSSITSGFGPECIHFVD